MTIAPVLIFTYKKVHPLKLTIEALQKNFFAPSTEVFIFSDGPKNNYDKEEVEHVRQFLSGIKGFKNITVNEADRNMGLATSIINGVTEILKFHDQVIVLEDDLVTSPNFLNFMNQALNKYKEDERIHSICGYTVPMEVPEGYHFDNYFTQRASSWGWATWKDRWDAVDWDVTDYKKFKNNSSARKKFNAMGSDMSGMLDKQMNGKISSWAIRWCYHQFMENQLSVFPTISKVANIGFSDAATHTKGSTDRFATPLDNGSSKIFNLNPSPELDRWFIKQFIAKYSLMTRALYKIKNLLRI